MLHEWLLGLRPEGLEWFTGAGLGIFVHWDHASQQGVEISWPVVGKSIIPGVDDAADPMTPEQYYSSAATFDPTNWDAREVARLARRATTPGGSPRRRGARRWPAAPSGCSS